MINLKIGGILLAAFIAGAFVASPELRAYAANTVGSSDIIDESILSQDIKNGEVKTLDIADGNVTNMDILNNAVTSAKLATGSVGTSDIATNGVTASDIATNAVGAAEIADGTVGAAEIADGTVGAAEIATDAVGSSEILDDSVGASELVGVSALKLSICTVDPPPLAAKRAVTVRATGGDCFLPFPQFIDTSRVIAVPPVTLEQGLVFVGSTVGNCTTAPAACYIDVRLHNPNEVTAVDGTPKIWSYIAFQP